MERLNQDLRGKKMITGTLTLEHLAVLDMCKRVRAYGHGQLLHDIIILCSLIRKTMAEKLYQQARGFQVVTDSEKPWAGWSKEKKHAGQRELGGKKLVRVASGGQLGSP